MIQFDCHAHVFEQATAIAGSRYTPCSPAPLNQWQSLLQAQQLVGGVIVQVSFLGTDNSQLCRALQQLNTEQFAGVAVVAPDAPDEEFDRLASLGVKGFRWNLVRGAAIPDLNSHRIRSFLERVFARNMHLEIHLESARLATFINPLLSFGGDIVIDHLGLPAHADPMRDPWLSAISQRHDLSNLYVKQSGAYRTAFDTTAHTDALLSLLPADRLIWGSDWPHTQHENAVDFNQIAEDRHLLPIRHDSKAVQSLYKLTNPLSSI